MVLMDKKFISEYGLPIVVTALLHALLLCWLAFDFVGGENKPLVKQPKAIQAQLVQLKEKRASKKPVKKKTVKKKAKKKVDKKKQKKLKQEKIKQQKAKKLAQQKAAKAKAIATKAKNQADKKRADDQRIAKEKLQKEALQREQLRKQAEAENLQREREEAFLDDFSEETLVDYSEDEAAAMSHIGAIQQAVSANWSRPPSARNGIEVTLSIQLFPTGQVNNVNIIKSSGNDAFDRSAVAAVQRAERFSDLANLEPRVFEKYFRTLKMKFKPEDLRL